MSKRVKLKNQRPQYFWGGLISGLIGAGASIYNNSKMASIQEEQMERQRKLAEQQAKFANDSNLATTLNNYASTVNNPGYQQEDEFIGKYKNGGKVSSKRRKLTNAGLNIEAGGQAIPLGNNTFLLRGGSHNDINEVGGTGIYANINGIPFEAQGNEVIKTKNNGTEGVVFSNEPMYADGSSPAERVLSGDNTAKVERHQNRFNRLHNVRPVGSRPQAKLGMSIVKGDYLNLGADLFKTLGGYFGSTLGRKDIDFDINLPEYTDAIAVSSPTDWDNAGQRAEVRRLASLNRQQIAKNRASAQVGSSDSQKIGAEELIELNKLWDERSNKRLELMSKNADRQQQAILANAAGRNTYNLQRGELLSKINSQKAEYDAARALDTTNLFTGIGNAGNNFVDSSRQRFEDENALKAYLAASGPGTASTMIAMGYDFSPNMLQSIYDAQKTYYDSNPNDKDAITRYNIAGRALYGNDWIDRVYNEPKNNNQSTVDSNTKVSSLDYLNNGLYGINKHFKKTEPYSISKPNINPYLSSVFRRYNLSHPTF